MKKRIVTSKINFGIFDGYALLSIGGTVKEVLKKEKDKQWKDYLIFLDKMGQTINFANKSELEGKKENIVFFSIFLENKLNEDWYIVLAHEVFHLCQFIAKHYHIDMIEEKESMAYLHSHLMKQILKLNK